jgi:hypothetical protein
VRDLVLDYLTLVLLWIAVIGSIMLARIEIKRTAPRIVFYLVLMAIVIRFCWWGDL